MQTLTLNNGVTMPLLGLGTYSLTGKAGQKAMSEAIEVVIGFLIAHKCIIMKPSLVWQ